MEPAHHPAVARKGRPSALLSPCQSSRSRKVTKHQGVSVWVPGAHRSPTGKDQSAPPRTPSLLSTCGRHGKLDVRYIDMSCHKCKKIYLSESIVPPQSELAKYHSAPAFSSTSYANAAEGKCSCQVLQGLFCSPCKARAHISMETSLRVDSHWEWV